MSIRRYTTAIAVTVTVALAQTWAQKGTVPPLPTGKWTGTITAPKAKKPSDVTFDITLKAEKLTLTIDLGVEQLPTSNVKAESGKLLFSFSPGGVAADCVLNRQDNGSYEGTCKDEKGGIGKITMVPPNKGAA